MTKKVKNIKSKINKEKKDINISDTFSFEQYGRTILAAVLIILILVAGYFSYQYKNGKLGENTKDKVKEEYKPTEDEIKFKEEYESLNGTKRSNGEINKKIEIDRDNNIVYISIDEASDLLKEGAIKRFDAGVKFGVDFVVRKVQIGFTYDLGLYKIDKKDIIYGDDSIELGYKQLKNRSFQILAGFNFK